MSSIEERLDRIEAHQQISQLVNRYAFALDSRDFDALGQLYIEDLADGGRAKVQADIAGIMKAFYRTMHQIVGHQIDIVDADHATGRVYTRAEHEKGDEWIDMAILYFDDYVRVDGRWYFAKRRDLHHVHVTNLTDRPVAPFVPNTPWTANRVPLPAAWGSVWTEYWADTSEADIATLTHTPVERP